MKLSTSLSLDLMTELRERAEEEAIKVFALNLKDLLLAAPAGARPTLGLDPGLRTGVKVAAIDATGKVVGTTTVYPFPPRNDLRGAQAELAALIAKHKIELIAIGNGTASRETERLVADMLAQLPGKKPTKVVVSEAGASVYSASALAAAEFPNLDVTLARRGLDRAAPARPARRTRQDRAEGDRRRAVSARRRPVTSWAARSTAWWRTRSTRSASISTRPPPRCSRGCRAWGRRWRRRSSRIATLRAPSRAARSC